MSRISVYIHLPFCRGRCPYCDFVSNDTDRIPFAAYQEAVSKEWRFRRDAARDRPCGSVYVGGGTPSLWPTSRLAALIDTVTDRSASARGASDLEITVEINPQDVGEPWLSELQKGGVNRFSIGVQALDNQRLRWLGRRHDACQAERAVQMAVQIGTGSVAADLIYGTPGQGTDDLVTEARALAGLGVHHISLYELTVHPETRLGRRVARGQASVPSGDQMADLWQAVGSALRRQGFERYEISSTARPGHRCRHNEHYWQGREYIGLGAGAWGFVVGADRQMYRYCNTSNVAEYIEAVDRAAGHPFHLGLGAGQFTERISKRTHARELVMLGLRTARGVSLSQVYANLAPAEAARWKRSVGELVAEGIAETRDDRLRLSESSLLLADEVAGRFF